jgi:uncharacterized protein (TIGR04551 family)
VVTVPKVEPPKETTKPKDPAKEGGEFSLVERPFPEEIHAKRYQFFQMGGYMRLRADRFIKPDLGLTNLNGGLLLGPAGGPIFGLPVPIELNDQNRGLFGDGANYSTSNMRLRLEPIFHVSESVRVMSQIDVFDNFVLGSTPASFPEAGGVGGFDGDVADLFGSSQFAANAIRVKRAWGEAQIPYGKVYFGRMGWHFGLGILSNDGNGPDNDFGDTVDRVAFSTKLAGHYVTGAFDWGGSGVFAAQPASNELGQSIDASQADDQRQFVLSGMKTYTPQEEERLRERGEYVLQYGLQGILRTQTATSEFNDPNENDPNAIILADRRATTVTADAWARFVWKDLRIEAEVAGVYGQVSCLINAQPGPNANQCQDPAGQQGGLGEEDKIDILAGGFVLQGDYALKKGKWKLGAELGAASGDPQTSFSLALQQQQNITPAQNSQLSAFLFDRDYRVDLILFRELLGTVNGAAYAKPTITFQPFSQLRLTGSAIYSMALAPQDEDTGENPNTPFSGNAPLGLEFNLGATYEPTDRFTAALNWGFLIPQSGLDAISNNQENLAAENAQAFRFRLGIKF